MNTTHKDGIECPLCSYRVLSSHPYLVRWYLAKKSSYINLHISYAWRSKEDQDRAYSEHKSLVKWPKSKHNFVRSDGTPESRALDLFQIDEDYCARFSPSFMSKLNDENKKESLAIRWGGDFKGLNDYCHFEIWDNVPPSVIPIG
jgi:hypothetical protein